MLASGLLSRGVFGGFRGFHSSVYVFKGKEKEKKGEKGEKGERGGVVEEFDVSGVGVKLNQPVVALKKAFEGIAVAKASPALLEKVKVEGAALGTLGQVSVREGAVVVSVFDSKMVKTVERALRDAGLGLHPQVSGQNVSVRPPKATAEYREGLAKAARDRAEQAKRAVRNVRKAVMDDLKKAGYTQDEQRRHEKDIQKITDQVEKEITSLENFKVKEITTA